MRDVFISHVEEDSDDALAIAESLEEAGFSTWCYERDSVPGPSYLLQTGAAVEDARAVVVLISKHSLGSRQVTVEIVRGHESEKPFVPVLVGLTHLDFTNRQPEWREAIGAATSIMVPRQGVRAIMPRIVEGLRLLGVEPSGPVPEHVGAARADAGRSLRDRALIGRLRAMPLWQRLGAAALLVVAALGLVLGIRLLGSGGGSTGGPPASPSAEPTPSASATAEPTTGGGGTSRLVTNVGTAQITDVRLATSFCPPAGFPGACKRPATGRFLILTLTGANGGALTIGLTQQANNSYVVHGTTRYPPSGDADEFQGVVRLVYSGVPAALAGEPIALVWPDGQRVALRIAR